MCASVLRLGCLSFFNSMRSKRFQRREEEMGWCSDLYWRLPPLKYKIKSFPSGLRIININNNNNRLVAHSFAVLKLNYRVIVNFNFNFTSRFFLQVLRFFSFNTQQLCNAFELDTMEYATRHLNFPYTHEPLGECVYEENRSDM